MRYQCKVAVAAAAGLVMCATVRRALAGPSGSDAASAPPATAPLAEAAPAQPAPAGSPTPADPPSFLSHFELRHSNTLEVRYDRIETPIVGLPHTQNLGTGWLFSNETLICNFEICNGTSLVVRPRLTWQFEPRKDPDYYFHELYLSLSAIPHMVVSAGSQVQGWGPGIFYSPTNRIFPETLFTTAVREPIRRRLVTVNVELKPELTLFATVARADDSDWSADRSLRSYFASTRVEYQAQGESPFTLGAVAGGGERFQPYGGMYFEKLISDAWTAGAEFAVSKGYSRDRDPMFGMPGLFLHEDAWGFDGIVNLRYGLASGGEVGAEVGVNEFALGDAGQKQLSLLYPVLLAGTAAGAGVPPVLDQRYAMVHARLPDLPPGKHVTLSTSFMYTSPSDSLVAAGELSFTYENLKGFASFEVNLGPEASVQRFPFERFGRVGVSFTL